jgi:hypothetical protein
MPLMVVRAASLTIVPAVKLVKNKGRGVQENCTRACSQLAESICQWPAEAASRDRRAAGRPAVSEASRCS